MATAATILVVDDQPYVRRTIRSLLAEQSHWEVHEAENGKIALDQTRSLKPHVVVMDIVMPEMSGIEAAYEIRKHAPETKIILISSHYTPEEAALLARLFGDGNFVQKSEAPALIPIISRLLPDECAARPALKVTHHHIYWSGGWVDWERFSTRAEAEAGAKQLARPGETYTIEEHDDETCSQCQKLKDWLIIHP